MGRAGPALVSVWHPPRAVQAKFTLKRPFAAKNIVEFYFWHIFLDLTELYGRGQKSLIPYLVDAKSDILHVVATRTQGED